MGTDALGCPLRAARLLAGAPTFVSYGPLATPLVSVVEESISIHIAFVFSHGQRPSIRNSLTDASGTRRRGRRWNSDDWHRDSPWPREGHSRSQGIRLSI